MRIMKQFNEYGFQNNLLLLQMPVQICMIAIMN